MAARLSIVALQVGGQLFGVVFLARLVVAQFACKLASQASAPRLLYAMGRDAVTPKAVPAGSARSFTPGGEPGNSSELALGRLESGADSRANLAAIDLFVAEAARDGAALVAFPEYATL